jgi:uncharacterized protein (TIGR03435 family)
VIGKGGPKPKPAEAALTPKQLQQRSAANRKRMEEMWPEGTPPTGFRTLTIRSITTEGFATSLFQFTEVPVVDETGLTGKYSITIETWKGPDAPGGTVFEAVDKLGLKLEPRKVVVESVVVDQVFKTPTAN